MLVNSESTILAIEALRTYKELNRVPEAVNVIAPFHGKFYYGNGYGDAGDQHGYTSSDGKTIRAYVYNGYRDQYANYKLLINDTGTFEHELWGILSYRETTCRGYDYKVSIILRAYDPNGKKIEDREYVIDTTLADKTVTKTIHIKLPYCLVASTPGEYTINTLYR